MRNENKRRVLAGVIAAQLVLQAAAMNVTVFAEETTTEAPTTAAAENTATTEAADAAQAPTALETAANEAITAAADAITLTNATQIPTELKQGKLVNIKGTLTSAESNITAVTIAIYDANNQRVTGGAAQPKAKTYDLSRLDDFVTFDKLAPGKYTYRVIASNAANTNYIVQESVFTVVAEGTATTTPTTPTQTGNDVLSISGVTTVPDSIKQGTPLTIKGTVTSSSSTITYLTCGVYDANGKFVTGKTIAPKVTSYDLNRLDAYIAFDKLAAGTYTFAVIATNASNTNYALVNKSFKVEGAAATEDKITLTGATEIPDSLKLGAVLSIRGTVTSANSNITALTAGVYDENGKFMTGKTVAPNAKSYDLKNLDAYIAFNKLAAGTYTYAVIATNAANNNLALMNKKFTVGSSTSATTTPTGEDKLTITGGTTVPETLGLGKALNVTGTVTSASTNMTALTVGIYNSENGKFMTGKTINPKAKTYNLKNLDAYVEFNKLPAGQYVYAVIASNGANTNYALVNKTFKVGSGTSTTTPAGDDKLTITGGTTVPSNLAVGKALNVVGTVTSANSNMTALTVGVYDSKGNFKTGKTINPAAKTYNLKNLDKYVEFNKLAAGSYVYAVIASNAANTNYALVNKSFTVGNANGNTTTPSNGSDALTISGGTVVPSSLAVGKAVIVRGTVTSANSNMTALTVGVYDSNGNFKTGKTINPASKTYDLKKLDAYVAFNTLPAGTYTYAVIATNAANTNYALVNQKFTVGSGTATTNDGITISGGTSMASTIAKGKGVIVRGTVTSASSNLTSVTVGVYDANGKMVTGKTANPNAKSYNVNALDSSVRFDQLAVGTYTYRVIASNAANNGYTVVNQTFTVK